jgi:hypothetical protein
MRIKIERLKRSTPPRLTCNTLTASIALAAALGSTGSHAITLKSDSDWRINFDTSLQWLVGVRAESRDSRIANDPLHHSANYKFDRGDLVTNRVQGMFELTGVYQDRMGFRMSANAWNDFAYDDKVEVEPGYVSNYRGGKYSSHTKKYHIRGAELGDAFASVNSGVTGYSLVTHPFPTASIRLTSSRVFHSRDHPSKSSSCRALRYMAALN